MKSLKIGEVAKRSGVGIETIRYYERKGLLDKPRRGPSGYRQYDHAVVARLRFIRRSKALGFTLAEIDELLGLGLDQDTKCCDVQQKARRKIAEIEAKVRALNEMKCSLKRLIDQCNERGSVQECPLLAGLDEGGEPPSE